MNERETILSALMDALGQEATARQALPEQKRHIASRQKIPLV